MDNPFSLSFGTIPQKYIQRPSDLNLILDEFSAEIPSNHVRIITGVRGSGKTVLLTELGVTLRSRKEWVVVEVNPETDIMDDLVSKLYNLEDVKPMFTNLSVTLGFSGSGVSFANSPVLPTSDVIVEKMLEILKRKGKRLLISLDEAVNNAYVKKFVHSFQILLRKEYPVFLVMTGLSENISNLQDDKSLTFLYRAPKLYLGSLSLPMISDVYQSVFSLEKEVANRMAILTKGYPFAFQVLGYLKWESKDSSLDDLLKKYDFYLSEYVYEKIWSELSEKCRLVLSVFKNDQPRKVQEIRDSIGCTSSQFSTYRKTLLGKGLVEESDYGYLRLSLPRFCDFIQNMLEW